MRVSLNPYYDVARACCTHVHATSSRAKGRVCTAHAQPFAASCVKFDVDKLNKKKKEKRKKKKRTDSIVLEARDFPVVVDPSTLRSRDCVRPWLIVDLLHEMYKVSSVSDWFTAHERWGGDGGKRKAGAGTIRKSYLGNALTLSRESIVFTPSVVSICSSHSSLRPSLTLFPPPPAVIVAFCLSP